MAVAYNSGKIIDSCELITTGKPYRIKLTPDRTLIQADKQDLCFIKIEIVDKKGRVVPYADNFIEFKVQGEGKVVGVGNGNPASIESFQKPYRKAYEGRCLLVVKASGTVGKISVISESKGLKSDGIEIISKN